MLEKTKTLGEGAQPLKSDLMQYLKRVWDHLNKGGRISDLTGNQIMVRKPRLAVANVVAVFWKMTDGVGRPDLAAVWLERFQSKYLRENALENNHEKSKYLSPKPENPKNHAKQKYNLPAGSG